MATYDLRAALGRADHPRPAQACHRAFYGGIPLIEPASEVVRQRSHDHTSGVGIPADEAEPAVTHALQELVSGRVVKRTPLTSARRRQAVRRVRTGRATVTEVPLPPASCQSCGAPLERNDYRFCPKCRPEAKEEASKKAAVASREARRVGRAAGKANPSHTPKAKARLSRAIAQRDAEALAWKASHLDLVVDPLDFVAIREGLKKVTGPRIAKATGLSATHAASIRNGRYVPHPRHWPTLANLAGVACPFDDTSSGALDLTWWNDVLLPNLSTVSTVAIGQATGLSKGQCSKVRRGVNIPNPRHWRALAELAGVALPEERPPKGNWSLE